MIDASTTRILVVEDDPKTANAIRVGLHTEGYEVVVADGGDRAISLVEAAAFEAIILDWMLPGRSGIEVLQWLRGRRLRTPVLLLTARDALDDRVRGLDSGADDYLAKPFALAELLARVRALLRRADKREPLQYKVGDLVVDVEIRQVSRAGRKVLLTPRELDLLGYLARHRGQTVSRSMIARHVWRELHRATPLDNVIDVHIAHLRRKIDGGHAVKLLHTVRGVGFVLEERDGAA
jgi:DNA-binding response OmpR family regulator